MTRAITTADYIQEETRYLQNLLLAGITDPVSRGASKADTFNNQSAVTITPLTYKPACFTSLTVDSVAQTFMLDYYNDFNSTTVTLDVAPTNDTVVVTYKYYYQGANTDKCWVVPSFPKNIVSYPLISIDHIGGSDEVDAMPNNTEVTSRFAIDIWSKGSSTVGPAKQRDDLAQDIRALIKANRVNMSAFGMYGVKITNIFNNDSELDYDVRRKTMELETIIHDDG